MVNLVIKMLLEDKEFSKKLQNAKGELKGIDALGGAAFKGIAGAVTRVAGAVGVAMGGMEAFNKLMASSQTLADSWGATMEAAKTSVDNFFYSLGSGDFSAFDSGLAALTDRAREAYAALDDLGNVTMAFNYANAQDNAKLQLLMNQARDKSLSEAERRAAADEASALQQKMYADAVTYRDAAKNTALLKVSSRTNVDASLFTQKYLDKALRLDIDKDRAAQRERIFREYTGYSTDREAITRLIADNEKALSIAEEGRDTKYMKLLPGQRDAARERDAAAARANIAKYEAELRVLEEKYAEVVAIHALLEIYTDDQLNQLGKTIITTENAVQRTATLKNTVREAAASINNVGGKARTSTVRTRGEDGAFVFGDTGVGGSLASAFAGAEDFQRRQREAQAEAERRALEQSGLAAQIEGLPAHMTNIAIPEDTIDKLRETTSAVQQLGGAFGQLGNAIGGNAGALVSWVGSLMEASAGMAQTIAMLNAESQAHNTNATAATADAGANMMAAHAGIPFAGIAIGAAAVATMVATLLSLPKFAKGGIATGPTIGLFGEAGTEAIIPLDRLDSMLSSNARPVRVVGELRARGKDLVGTISNYEKVQAVR